MVALVGSLVLVPVKGTQAAEPNPIVVENQHPGTGDWQMGRPGFQTSNDATGQIKGYASATSVNKGGTIAFHVSVNPAQTFTADIFRMGWYSGLGGRHDAGGSHRRREAANLHPRFHHRHHRLRLVA